LSPAFDFTLRDFWAGYGVSAASFMGEHVGDSMAFVTGVGTLGV
jgi:hypothetical protein